MHQIRRYATIFLSTLLPWVRAHSYSPCRETDKPGGYRYYCWLCGSEKRGYHTSHIHVFGEGRPICETCQRRRDWYDWKTWFKTGEYIKVDDVDGEGWSRPSTTNGCRVYAVYRLFGFEFVHADAARRGKKNVKNARHWFRTLDVEGNTQMVEKIKGFQKYDAVK
mgnify:CR=1 FL=1